METKNNELYVPYINKKNHEWCVKFPDRYPESGDIIYVISEYLEDGFIYEYNCDDKINHEHSFSGVLEAITMDCICGHKIDIIGYEEEYSAQERHIILSLIKKITNNMSPYNINKIINEINEETKRPVFKIGFTEDKNISIYNSKIGGIPFWVKDKEYPCFHGHPMNCIAQINLSELPENNIFPKIGMLQFFIAGKNYTERFLRGGSKVIYHKNLENALHIKEEDYKEASVKNPVLKEAKMMFEKSEESISIYNPDFQTYKSRFSPELKDVIKYIIRDRFNHGMGSKLLGYPTSAKSLPNIAVKEYDLLLFQLDSDLRYINWFDCGVGNFFINTEKLKNLDFSDIFFTYNTY